MRLEVSLTSTLRIFVRLVELVGNSHVHLHFDARQVYLVLFITHNEVLVAIVPEQRMSLHLNKLVCRCVCIALRIVLESVDVVELHGDDGTCLRVFNLESTVEDADLEPMVAIEL